VKQQHGGQSEICELGDWGLIVWFLQAQENLFITKHPNQVVKVTIHLVLLRLRMSGAVPPLLHLLPWHAQGQLYSFLYIFRCTAWPDSEWNSSKSSPYLICCQFLHESNFDMYWFSQMFEPFQISKGVIGYLRIIGNLCIMILSFVLVMRHEYKSVFASRPTSLLVPDTVSVPVCMVL
jgi:hypothetical protein